MSSSEVPGSVAHSYPTQADEQLEKMRQDTFSPLGSPIHWLEEEGTPAP